MKHEKANNALMACGLDLTTSAAQNDKEIRTGDGDKMIAAAKFMAVEAKETSNAAIDAKANSVREAGGITKEAIDHLFEFEDIIHGQEKIAKKTLENVRSMKSAMSLELKTLTKLVAQLKQLDLSSVADELERVQGVMESDTLKKLFAK